MAALNVNKSFPYIINEKVIESFTSTINVAPKKDQVVFQFKKKPVYDVFKRVFDIIFSLMAIVVLFPLMVFIAIAIVIDDFGNPIFIQERVGKNGKVFHMLKFRSMHKDAEKKRSELLELNEVDGPLFKLRDDPRVTKVGKIIRRTSADELPQLFNILHGTMSVVGPRPFVTYEQEKFNEYQSQRLLVKPGLSCYWQAGRHHNASFDDLVESDLSYIMERSFRVDIKIIFKTFFIVINLNGV